VNVLLPRARMKVASVRKMAAQIPGQLHGVPLIRTRVYSRIELRSSNPFVSILADIRL
jgi:hypothetical protein